MSFEYRELTTQVFLNAGKEDKSPCQGATKHEDCEPCNTCGTTTIDEPSAQCHDEDCDPCNTCGTTTIEHQTDDCDDEDRDKGKRKALGLLRQQLRDTLAAG